MTLFGKAVLGGLFVVVSLGIFYGVTTYVNKDNEAMSANVVPQTQEVVATTTPTEVATSTVQNKKMSFVDFMKQGGSHKCTVSQSVASMVTNGIVYINNSSIRGDFEVSVSGQTIKSNMISKDGYVYTWTSAMPTKGFKSKVATGNQGDSSTQNKGTYTWDGSQIGEYSCEPWTVDEKMFELPKTVTFTQTP
jgi:hypothetical protein